jgi:hypothetical protein
MKPFKKFLSVFIPLAMLATVHSTAQEPDTEHLSDAQIAEMINNPLGNLWMLATQNDTYWMDGDIQGADKVHVNVATIMPIMPMQLTEGYKLILRPWIPIVSTDFPRNGSDLHWSGEQPDGTPPAIGIKNTSWDSGLGDMGFWAAIASNEAAKPPFVWGVGITTQFDTASQKEFGSGRYSAGPMGLAFYIGDEWIVGSILQHWWDYAGDDKRKHVNKTNFQYNIYYRLDAKTKIGMSPNIIYDWEADKYDIPVGLGANTLVKLGKVPVTISAELQYHFSNNDAIHNRWHLRLNFMPILPSPAWSKKPIFQ